MTGRSRPPVGPRLPGLCLLLVGLGLGLETSTYEVVFMSDPVGPRALPGLASAILFAAGVFTMLRPPEDFTWLTRSTATRTGLAAGIFFRYSVLLPVLGFFVATTMAVSGLSKLFEAPGRKALGAAALLSAALWLLFVPGLGLPLPIGSLWIL